MKVTHARSRRPLGALFVGCLALVAGRAEALSMQSPGPASDDPPDPLLGSRAQPLPPSGLRYPLAELRVPEAQPIGSFTPLVARGPVTSFALAAGQALPAGLVLDPRTGVLSGTPVELLPPTSITILAANAGGSTQTSFTLEVFGVAPTSLDYSPTSLQVEVGGGPFTAFPSVQGGPVDLYQTIGAPLPAGLVLDPVSGILSGNPTALHPPTLHTIEASNETGATTYSFLIEVSVSPRPGPLSYPPGPLALSVGAPIAPLTPTITGRVDRYSVEPALPNRLLTVSGGMVLPRTGVLLPDNPVPIPYTPPEQTFVHPWEVLNVWLPAGTPPTDGWPCVLSNPDAGYFGAPPYDDFDPNDPIETFYTRCLNAGIAVVFAGIIDSGPLTAWFYPPGHPSGRWEDFDELMPEKDLLHALQWVKSQSTYPLDPTRVFLHGVSAGSTLAGYVALGPDLARTSGSQQVTTSTSVAGVLCFDLLTSFPAYSDDDLTLPHHWESVSLPGTSAVDMADADPAILDANSVARILLDPRSYAPITPVFLAYDCQTGSIDYSNDSDHFPALRNVVGANVHDLWHGAKLWERLMFLNAPLHQAKSEFWVSNGFESTLGSLQGAQTGTFTGTTLDSTELYDAAVAWMVLRARESKLDPEGLRLHPWSGWILGTPRVSQPTRMYTVTATNPGGSTTATTLIRIDAARGSGGP